ncbi:MAG TPA: nicotinate-nucleotide--dimethylbenzimidazole phosphoribosyltransferase [Steroidobacteraceae bacterium]|nr:nicotinate-nucleotide--dimethylbenzimidazole phosphoribosyltransferase [Steroidobacteraceae bacterium]
MTAMITTQTLQRRLDTRTKPQGSLGVLESLALQLGSVLQTETPVLRAPAMFVFAADHGIAADAVSAYPQAVTGQMLENYRSAGAAINVLARQHGLSLTVVDAGVIPIAASGARPPSWIAAGTRNFRVEPAMSAAQCTRAIETGRVLATDAVARGSNALLLGEMGIGNTSCAALLLHRRTGWPLAECVGRGTGLDDPALDRKRQLLDEASARRTGALSPLETLIEFGGFEIAMLAGALLEVARHRCIVVVDGFAVSVAALLAIEMDPRVRAHCIFSHCSAEIGHRRLLEHLQAQPLLDLRLRLGEGSGAALAWPLIDSAARLMTEMASFESAGVADRARND